MASRCPPIRPINQSMSHRYSDRIPFRERSETSSIAIELSLQPWRAFQPDGVIMFSDILTPLPALGVEFDVIKGKGPVIHSPLRRCARGWVGAGLRSDEAALGAGWNGMAQHGGPTRTGMAAAILCAPHRRLCRPLALLSLPPLSAPAVRSRCGRCCPWTTR